jgi:hypothetical protein
MKPEVEIYDTTLRDGSQGEGINFSALDKVRIAEKLDAFGIHYIEGGWPGSNPKDMEFFKEARRRKFKRARLAAFRFDPAQGCRRWRATTRCACCSRQQTPVVTIFGKTWLLHVTEVLRDDAGGEPGDDRRHGALPEGPGAQVRDLRRRARLSTATRTTPNMPWRRGRRRRRRAWSAWCCATPTAAALPREVSRNHRGGAGQALHRARGHPHPR